MFEPSGNKHRARAKQLWYTFYAGLTELVWIKANRRAAGARWTEERVIELLRETCELIKVAPCI